MPIDKRPESNPVLNRYNILDDRFGSRVLQVQPIVEAAPECEAIDDGAFADAVGFEGEHEDAVHGRVDVVIGPYGSVVGAAFVAVRAEATALRTSQVVA